MWTWDQTNITFDNAAVHFDGTISPTAVLAQPAKVASFPNGGTGNTATAVLNGVTAGNTIFAVTQTYSVIAGGPTITVSDGTAYTDIVADETGPTPNWTTAAIFMLQNANAGTHTIVGTNSAGSGNAYGYMTVFEVSGILSVSPLDQFTGDADHTGTVNVTTGTMAALAGTNEFVIATFAYRTATTQAFSEPAYFNNVSNNKNGFTPQIVCSVDTLTPTGSIGRSASWGTLVGASWASVIAAFKISPVPAYVTPPYPSHISRRIASSATYPN